MPRFHVGSTPKLFVLLWEVPSALPNHLLCFDFRIISLKNSFGYATLHNIIFVLNGQCSIRRPHLSNYTHQTTYGLTSREIWALKSKNSRISTNRLFRVIIAIICNLLLSTLRDGNLVIRPFLFRVHDIVITNGSFS